MNLYEYLGRLAAYILRPYFLSFRYRAHFEDPTDAQLIFPLHPQTHPLVFAFFHQQGFSLMPVFIDSKMVSIVSASKDGTIAAAIFNAYGFLTTRGSSRRGGNQAFHDTLNLLKQGYSVTVATDGPKGPIYKIKHGAITLSERANIPIVPFTAKTKKKWIVSKAWDQSYFPYPFSKIDLYFAKVKFYSLEELENKLLAMDSSDYAISNYSCDHSALK